MTRKHLVAWSDAERILPAMTTYHTRPAVLMIGLDLYAVDTAEDAAEVEEAPWLHVPLLTITAEQQDDLLGLDGYDWPSVA